MKRRPAILAQAILLAPVVALLTVRGNIA